ncbi:MAG TPA: lamin tail domain-containing protein [Candidatus Saccharimonadaceae bacterium]|nr:lamin tail domain-containing protein [Candidatus Saccharimonadaceae bacterium]
MLKLIVVIIVGVVLIQQIAYVPPTYAASATIVISEVQSGVTGGATQEFISLYNNSASEVDLTDWCLRNKNDVAIGCLYAGMSHIRIFVPSYGHATIASSSYAQAHSELNFAHVFEPLNQSSGSLVGSSDTLVLVDASGDEVDRMSWTETAPSGMIYQRAFGSEGEESPLRYADTDSGDDWQVVERDALPNDTTYYTEIEVVVPRLPTVKITELLPNASGADAGKEFIELQNYGTETVDLSGAQLWVGVGPVDVVSLPDGVLVEPGEYFVVTHGLVDYTLVNTTGKVGLASVDGVMIDVSAEYQSPKDNRAWALIGEVWQYTNQPTPGAENLPDKVVESVARSASSTLKPCASNQYRHPQTNRCRLIQAASSAPAPCRADQYRSPETNRCRKIASEPTITPCREGQERNPDTNRCRNIKAMSVVDYEVLGAETEAQPDQWYVIAAIGLGVLGLAVYGAWEWRHEIRQMLVRVWKFVSRRK